MGYACRVLADSLNAETGDRVATMLVTYPLMVHAEFLRHRAFSYSVASNRAIPTKRLLGMVGADPFVPARFPRNGKGMSPDGWMEGTHAEDARLVWLDARDDALAHAERLGAAGVHKQIANRVLAPFQWVTQLTTGDVLAYENFFAQRCHPDAQAEIRTIADMVRAAWDDGRPVRLAVGEWHLPFVDAAHLRGEDNLPLADLKRLSVARSARTSYLTHDGEHSTEADVALHDRLLVQTPPHLSPFEHQLVAMPFDGGDGRFTVDVVRGHRGGVVPVLSSPRYANVRGFKSYRRELEEARVA